MGRPKRASTQRGPDAERMWRRITSLFKLEMDWEKNWTAEELVDFLIEHESRPPSREDIKVYRKRILSDVQELIQASRSTATTSNGKGTMLFQLELVKTLSLLNRLLQIGQLGFLVWKRNP